jgi:hypothetical protein
VSREAWIILLAVTLLITFFGLAVYTFEVSNA